MVDTEYIRNIVGIIGNVISFFLFISPAPTFYTIWKQGAVEGFEPDPYLACVLNCMLWVFYGLPFVHPNSILVVTINGFGLGLELIYLIFFFVYAPGKKRMKIVLVLFIEVIFVGGVVAITILCFHNTTKRSMLVGIIAVIFNVCMYMSPLLIMGKVIRTKSVKYMPFLLSLANFLNGVVWVIYALLRFDPYVLTGNSLGALGGFAQLVLYAIYYKSTPKGAEDRRKQKAPEVELSAPGNNSALDSNI